MTMTMPLASTFVRLSMLEVLCCFSSQYKLLMVGTMCEYKRQSTSSSQLSVKKGEGKRPVSSPIDLGHSSTMDVQRMARRLQIYGDHFKQKIESLENGTDHSMTTSMLDRRPVQMNELNDFTSDVVKTELNQYETTGEIKVIPLCNETNAAADIHNPKEVSLAVGNVMLKWDTCLSECSSSSSLVASLNEGTEKLLLHLTTMTNLVLEKRDVASLTLMLSSASLVGNQLHFYAKTVQQGEMLLSKSCSDIDHLTQALFTQLEETQVRLLATCVLQSCSMFSSMALSSMPKPNLSSNVYYWSLHMKCLRADLFSSLSSSMAQRMLIRALEVSLDVFLNRYHTGTIYCVKNEPLDDEGSERRWQGIEDVKLILETSHSMLLSLIHSPKTLLSLSKMRSFEMIHRQCFLLLQILVARGSPLDDIVEVFAERSWADMKKTCSNNNLSLEPLDKRQVEYRLTSWLRLIRPELYDLEINSKLTLLILIIVSNPWSKDVWKLIVQVCLIDEHFFVTLMLENLGHVVTESKGSHEHEAINCNGLMCKGRCCPPTHWTQRVVSGLLHIVAHGSGHKSCLVNAMEAFFENMEAEGWDVFNANVVWSMRKPAWYQGLLDLVQPFVFPVLDDLLEALMSSDKLAIPEELVSFITSSMFSISSFLPLCLLQLCEVIEGLLPSSIRPSCDSILVHMLISSFYTLLTTITPILRSWGMSRSRLDVLMAVGEKLCTMDAATHLRALQKLEGLTDASAKGQSHSFIFNEDTIDAISNIVVQRLLGVVEGEQALMAVHHFVVSNGEWLCKVMAMDNLQVTNAHILRPWGVNVHREVKVDSLLLPNSFHESRLREINWSKWLRLVINDDDYQNNDSTRVFRRILEKREDAQTAMLRLQAATEQRQPDHSGEAHQQLIDHKEEENIVVLKDELLCP